MSPRYEGGRSGVIRLRDAAGVSVATQRHLPDRGDVAGPRLDGASPYPRGDLMPLVTQAAA